MTAEFGFGAAGNSPPRHAHPHDDAIIVHSDDWPRSVRETRKPALVKVEAEMTALPLDPVAARALRSFLRSCAGRARMKRALAALGLLVALNGCGPSLREQRYQACEERMRSITDIAKRDLERIYRDYPPGFERDALASQVRSRASSELDNACPWMRR